MTASTSTPIAHLCPTPSPRWWPPVAPLSVGSARPRTRALVKIQDGCENRCAYCIVPDARGPARSARAVDVVDRVARLHANGTAEVVLTGVNIGRYRDAGSCPDLATLVERIAETGIRRIRLSSIEPPDLDARLLGVLAAHRAVVAHLHVPLQSGCDRTLAAMRRRRESPSASSSGTRGSWRTRSCR
jgi:threonylcarbamoyladenosine tRNA methylthiotransferase MtaB